MKVIALKDGFFDGSRQRAGDEFDVPQGTKGSWFTPVKEPKVADARDAKAKADAGAKGKNPDDLV